MFYVNRSLSRTWKGFEMQDEIPDAPGVLQNITLECPWVSTERREATRGKTNLDTICSKFLPAWVWEVWESKHALKSLWLQLVWIRNVEAYPATLWLWANVQTAWRREASAEGISMPNGRSSSEHIFLSPPCRNHLGQDCTSISVSDDNIITALAKSESTWSSALEWIFAPTDPLGLWSDQGGWLDCEILEGKD